MCNPMCLEFIRLLVTEQDIQGKRVLESGAIDFNGSIRPYIESLQPASYIGTDVVAGSRVDVVCRAEKLVAQFGLESFGVVISTEAVEHIEDWRAAFQNFKEVLEPGGLLLITTRSEGFGYHGNAMYGDYWRYSLQDMRHIFSDMEILALQADPTEPGVFVKVRKPALWKPVNLQAIELQPVRKA